LVLYAPEEGKDGEKPKTQSVTMKTLKAVAELEDTSPSELLERIVRCAFEGEDAFSKETRQHIEKIRGIYEQRSPS